MSSLDTKEVRFDIWCPTCLYFSVDDTMGKDPCNRCLAESARKNTTKPIEHKGISSGSVKKSLYSDENNTIIQGGERT